MSLSVAKPEKKPENNPETQPNSSLSQLQQSKPVEKENPLEEIEKNPNLTEEQKEEIFKQEEIAKEITKDLDFAINSNEKSSEFEEIKGILSKKGKLGKYKEWYFCVVGNSLCFYESSKLNKKEGELEFSKIKSISIRDSKTKKNKGKKFEIHMDKGQVALKAKSESEAQKWVAYLNYSLQMYQINKI